MGPFSFSVMSNSKFAIVTQSLDTTELFDQYFDTLVDAQSIAVSLARNLLQSPSLTATSTNTSVTIKDETGEVVAEIIIHELSSFTSTKFTDRRGFD